MTVRDTQESALPTTQKLEFSAAEIGALAHLYRGEVYRSTAWRTRLDSTTNWAVVTTGIALSATFSSAEASPLPMVLVGLIVLGAGWAQLLAKDYCDPRYHISFARAIGRRLRRTYAWIFVIQAVAYYGKLAIHPTPLATLADLWERAAIGPIPGGLVVVAGVLFHGAWAVLALVTYRTRSPRDASGGA